MQSFKVIGPPGTGKTSYLLRQVERAVPKLRRNRVVLVSSLTKAAASEFRSRLPEFEGTKVMVGTLHSHCYKALSCPNMIKPADIDEWNSNHKLWNLPRSLFSLDTTEEQQEKSEGWSRYHVLRVTETPRELWTEPELEFDDAFSQWKRLRDLHDFTDLIELAISRGARPSEWSPQFIFVDEAQDHDRLQWRLIQQWAADEECDHLILSGDPGQNLYEWRGSQPDAMEAAAPDSNRIVLSKSYRVPSAVHTVALRVHRRMTDVRHDDFEPRDGDPGEVLSLPVNLSIQQDCKTVLVPLIEREIAAKRRVMCLATCGYMLTPLLTELRRGGIPYCNPYKRDNARYNPLAPPARGVGWLDRLRLVWRAEQSWSWTVLEVTQWMALFQARLWKRGTKTAMEARAKTDPQGKVTADALYKLAADGDVFRRLVDDPRGFAASHATDKRVEYATRVVSRWGEAALYWQRLVIGTVHSVKGGEADTVILGTELSPQEYQGLDNGVANQIHRKFYVGCTRSKERLIVLTRPRLSTGGHCYGLTDD